MTGVADVVDRTLDWLVVPGFSRIGYDLRRRLYDWEPPAGDLSGRTMVVTGATSGLGRATALVFARAGATVVIAGRDAERTGSVRDELVKESGNPDIRALSADMAEPGEVRALGENLVRDHPSIDALVHNAGALISTHTSNPVGIETTVAIQVVGPFLLTALTMPSLERAPSGRVIMVASGGMYTAKLDVDRLETVEGDYRGSARYALAKRAQVALNEIWAERAGSRGVSFAAMHPGWVDTPGLRKSLPRFSRLMGPLLRDERQGCDTLVWLATTEQVPGQSGRFWHDRRPRPTHRLGSTRRSDTPAERERLWRWSAEAAGVPVEV